MISRLIYRTNYRIEVKNDQLDFLQVAQMTKSEMTSFDLSMLVPWVMFLYIFWQMNYLPQSFILWAGVVSEQLH